MKILACLSLMASIMLFTINLLTPPLSPIVVGILLVGCIANDLTHIILEQ